MRKKIVEPIRVLIVSPNHIERRGLRLTLETEPHFVVAGEISVARNAVEVAAREHPDIILIDIDDLGVDVVSLILDFQKAAKNSRLLLLSSLRNRQITHKALCAGVTEVVLKTQPADVLITVIECLYAEATQVECQKTQSAQIAVHDVRTLKQHNYERKKINTLTVREREIIVLLGKGLRNKNIAERLCISEQTVRHHLTTIYSKLEVSDRQKLLILAHQYRLVEYHIY